METGIVFGFDRIVWNCSIEKLDGRGCQQVQQSRAVNSIDLLGTLAPMLHSVVGQRISLELRRFA